MRLRDILSHQDAVKLGAIFGSEALDTPVTIEPVDGALGVCGTTSGSLWSSKSSIRFDSGDVKMIYTSDESNYPGIKISTARRVLDMTDASTRLTVLHELVHVEQRQRGFFYRLKMKWWNKTKKYEERPHEIEAEQRAAELAARW